MDKVRNDLQDKQADEYRKHAFSLGGLFAGAVGPDGGMSATAAYNDTINYTGKWNTKTTEDYIDMVKDELKRQHIMVDESIEKMMIDKMISDRIPKSSIDISSRNQHSKPFFIYLKRLENHLLKHELMPKLKKGTILQPLKKEQVQFSVRSPIIYA